MGRESPPSQYPQPIPWPTTDLMVHLPDDLYTLLMFESEDAPGLWHLPGAVFRPDMGIDETPLEAGLRRLEQKVTGIS